MTRPSRLPKSLLSLARQHFPISTSPNRHHNFAFVSVFTTKRIPSHPPSSLRSELPPIPRAGLVSRLASSLRRLAIVAVPRADGVCSFCFDREKATKTSFFFSARRHKNQTRVIKPLSPSPPFFHLFPLLSRQTSTAILDFFLHLLLLHRGFRHFLGVSFSFFTQIFFSSPRHTDSPCLPRYRADRQPHAVAGLPHAVVEEVLPAVAARAGRMVMQRTTTPA